MSNCTSVTFETTDFEQACGYSRTVSKTDVLQGYIKLLESKESQKDRDGAGETLKSIQLLLDAPDTMAFTIEEKNYRTLLAVHYMIKANPIRLRYKAMDITGYFNLLKAIKGRLFNKNPTIMGQRWVVAEEMSKLGLFPQMITERWQLRYTKAPNREFMNILYEIRPEFAQDDILRREYSKLGIAWQKGDEELLNKTREKIKELGGSDYLKDVK